MVNICKCTFAFCSLYHQPKNHSTAQWAEKRFHSNKEHEATPCAQDAHKDSLSLLEGGDLTFDLVVLPRHLAVLLVHQHTLLQRHTGRHRLWGKYEEKYQAGNRRVQRKKHEEQN